MQSETEVRKHGASVKVFFKASRYTFTEYYMHCVQKTLGQELEWIGEIIPNNGGTNDAKNFKGIFAMTADTSTNKIHIKLRSMRSEDMSVYYCVRHSMMTHILKCQSL